MEFIQIESSHLTEARYNKESRELEIKFRNGYHYLYFEVPESVYKGLMESESKGSYFHRFIKEKFICKLLTMNYNKENTVRDYPHQDQISLKGQQYFSSWPLESCSEASQSREFPFCRERFSVVGSAIYITETIKIGWPISTPLSHKTTSIYKRIYSHPPKGMTSEAVIRANSAQSALKSISVGLG